MYNSVLVIIDGEGEVIGVLPPKGNTAELLQQALESHHDAVDSAEVHDLTKESDDMNGMQRWTYTSRLEIDGDDTKEISVTPAGFYDLPTSGAHIMAAVQGIDWTMLREQKLQLLDVLNLQCLSQPQLDALTGILHLIDAVQDGAVDDGIANKKEVFNIKPEPHGVLELMGHSIAWQCDVELDDLNDAERTEICDQLLSLNEGELSAQGREGTIQWWKE